MGLFSRSSTPRAEPKRELVVDLQTGVAEHRVDYREVPELLLIEVNLARTEPKAYAEHIKPLLKCFDGTLLKRKGFIPIRTHEGKKAVAEAISFLEAAEPAPPIKRVSAGMSAAAADHAADLSTSGSASHSGADGSTPFDRLSRYGRWSGSAAENIALGAPEEAAEEVRMRVMQLIIDDGVPGRGHRENLFNASFTVLGVAGDKHVYGRSLVITLAGSYVDSSESSIAAGRDKKAAAGMVERSAAAEASGATAAEANDTAAAEASGDEEGAPTPPPPAPKAPHAPPPGGKMAVKRSTVEKDKKAKGTTSTTVTVRTVTTVTTITDAKGNEETFTETTVEEIPKAKR